jgi:peptidoglycan/LPS O-acetylase OafA/YrhL
MAPVLWELKGGVAIFFVISGALLYLPYARAIRDRRELPGWRAYARRRALRILPAYWVVLTVLAIGPFGVSVFGPDAWRYYGLSQIYGARTLFGGDGVAWSLCAEVTFYALLPLFAWLAARLARGARDRAAVRIQLGLIAAAGAVTIAVRAALAGSPTTPFYHAGPLVLVSLPGVMDWFAIGMALAVLRAELEVDRAATRAVLALERRPWCCPLLAVALFLAAVPAQGGDMFLPWYGLVTHVALGLAAGVLVAPVMLRRPRAVDALPARILRHPAAMWLGTISYGIYLWQLPVLELIGRRIVPDPATATAASAAQLWLVVLAATVAMGAASWYLVERPVQRLVRARIAARATRPAAGRTREIDTTVQPQADAA